MSIYSTILENKSLSEAPSSSDELLGGATVKIPAAGAHKGQSGWQSNNAWDIQGSVGSPVYAIADGVAETFNDYGQTVTKTSGKNLYGQSFTVKSDNNLPSVYYTHLQGSPIKKGDTIKCGQFLGNIMDFPGSNFDHVHIGVESGDIKQFLNDDGTLKCAKGQKLGDGSVDTSSSDSTTDTGDKSKMKNNILHDLIQGVTSSIGLTEEKVYGKFGDKIKSEYGRILLPASENNKVKSPVKGVISSKGYNSSCVNQILITHEVDNKLYYLEYCGVSKPEVKKGDKVNKGTLLGKTDSDVIVTLYDSGKNKEPIEPFLKKEIGNNNSGNNQKTNTMLSNVGYESGVISSILQAPFKMFQDVKDDEGNVIEKRWGSPTEREQPVDWIKRKSPTYSKKLKEDINRIKGLLK